MPLLAHASAGVERLDLTGNWVGITSVLLFFVAYPVVMAEEFTALRSWLIRKGFGYRALFWVTGLSGAELRPRVCWRAPTRTWRMPATPRRIHGLSDKHRWHVG